MPLAPSGSRVCLCRWSPPPAGRDGAGGIHRRQRLRSSAVVAALVASIVGVVLFPRFTQLRLHRKIVANRLWTFEKPNTPTEVPALLRSEDVEAARVVLRRAQFNPQAFGLSLAVPPDDASDLDYKIAVQEPEAWPQADSPEDRTERIVGVLRAAGLRARVGGVDTFRGPE